MFFDVSQIAVARGIKTRVKLLALAFKQKKEGKTDLAEFVANRGAKNVDEAIKVGWELEESEAKIKRSKLSRMQILREAASECCVQGCDGKWVEMAEKYSRETT